MLPVDDKKKKKVKVPSFDEVMKDDYKPPQVPSYDEIMGTSEKKNPSEIGSKEPSVGGLVVDGTTPKTQDSDIPTVFLIDGNPVPSKDPIALSLAANKLKDAKKEVEVAAPNKTGYNLEYVP